MAAISDSDGLSLPEDLGQCFRSRSGPDLPPHRVCPVVGKNTPDTERIVTQRCTAIPTTHPLRQQFKQHRLRPSGPHQPYTRDARLRSTTVAPLRVIRLHNLMPTEEISVLAKGGNFAITPKNLSVEDIIANVDSSIRGLTETSRILQYAKPPKSNFTNKKRSAKEPKCGQKHYRALSRQRECHQGVKLRRLHPENPESA
ncbi:putative Rab GTPase-activating protein 1-like [Trypoxylus dichotomus]